MLDGVRLRLVLAVAMVLALMPGGSQAEPSSSHEPLYRGRTIPDMVQDLRHLDHRVRETAANGLGYLGPVAAPAVPALAEALGDDVQSVRLAAARALRALAPVAAPATTALIRALDDAYSDVRSEAAFALGGIGPDAKAAVPALVRLLGDRYAKLAAARALGSIGPEARDAIGPLELAERRESDERVRTELHGAIERIRWRAPSVREPAREAPTPGADRPRPPPQR